MINLLKKELIYYTVILVVLALIMHPDLLSAPLERFELMNTRGNYIHPFYWSFGVYLIVVIVRLLIKGIGKLKDKFKK